MLYFILKIIFRVALRVFFRKIEVRNKHLIPAQGPLLIAANHPNTFMDPIAIAAQVKQEVYFIAKGTLFNNSWHSWLLHQMNLIPVYRREDGVVTPAGNDATFRKCIQFLNQKGTLLIFPEGNSYNERRLRPLKTGTARIALSTEAAAGFKVGVKILPVGLNYSDPTQFRSNLFINIGEPIALAAYETVYAADAFAAAQQLTEELRVRLSGLVVSVADPQEDELVKQIEIIYKTNLAAALGLSNRQEDKFELTKAIVASIRYFNQQDPARVNTLQEKINCYNQNLQKLGLQDIYLNNLRQNTSLLKDSVTTLIFLIAGLPVYVWGLITNYLPYIIPSKIADNLTDEQEFRAPIMMTAGILTFPLFYSLFIWLFYLWQGIGWSTLFFTLTLPISGLFALHYSYRLRLTRGYLKLISVFYNRNNLINKVWQQRQEIIADLEATKELYLQQHTQTK